MGRLRTALGEDAGRIDFHSSAAWYQSPTEAFEKYRTYLRKRLDSGAQWLRIVGEPIWAGRSDVEIDEWVRYEALINLSFVAWPATILCSYDGRVIPPEIAAAARRTHPELAAGNEVVPSSGYLEPETLLLPGFVA
jgi:hypothetical protein